MSSPTAIVETFPIYQHKISKQTFPNNTHYYKFGAERPLTPNSKLQTPLSTLNKSLFLRKNEYKAIKNINS